MNKLIGTELIFNIAICIKPYKEKQANILEEICTYC